MLKSALKNIKKFKLKTKVLGVTLLTSLDGKDSEKIYGEKDTNKLIKKFALIASNANIAGLICSGQDLSLDLSKLNLRYWHYLQLRQIF